MPPSRPQDPRTLKIRDEEDQIKTLGPLSKPPGVDPNEAEATFFPGADATVAPGELEAPKPKSMVRGGAALTRPPVSDNEPATAPGKMAQPPIAAPRPAAAGAPSAPGASSARAAREVPVVAPRHPTETVLRPRAEAKRKSSWVMWLFAFLVLGGIGFGVSWFLINPSPSGSAPEAANTAPTPEPAPTAVAADTEAKAEPDAAAEPEVAAADGEPNAAPLPTEIAGTDAEAQADAQPDVQGEVQVAAAGADGATGADEVADTGGDASPASDAQLAAAPAEDTVVAAPAEADTAPPAQPDAQVAAVPVAPPVEVPRNPAEANRLNEAGLNARKAGDHGRAMQLYQEALKFNPDSVWARYNLACELALAGRSKEAFAELTTLYKLGTPESRKALAAARKDSDFDSIRDSGQFFRLTNF